MTKSKHRVGCGYKVVGQTAISKSHTIHQNIIQCFTITLVTALTLEIQVNT